MSGVTTRLWLRHEERATECRAPIVPEDARRLVESGAALTVEESPQRVFPCSEYVAAGCAIAPAGSWITAPRDTYIVALKELPDRPSHLTHRHLFFGHAYKGQSGAQDLLRRFAAGGGELLDLEHLVDGDGRRVAAFGYWAGYVGAALSVLHLRGALPTPLTPWSRADVDRALRDDSTGHAIRALVIGALGRCGRGARDALTLAGATPTCWDIAETAQLDRRALLDHDLFVNAVLTQAPIEPFLTRTDVADPSRRLALVCDVSCDVASPLNPLPIYDQTTTWERPVRRLGGQHRPLEMIAIDNLPSLLPREASVAFSGELLPHLMSLGRDAALWQRCRQAFHDACRANGIVLAATDV